MQKFRFTTLGLVNKHLRSMMLFESSSEGCGVIFSLLVRCKEEQSCLLVRCKEEQSCLHLQPLFCNADKHRVSSDTCQ